MYVYSKNNTENPFFSRKIHFNLRNFIDPKVIMSKRKIYLYRCILYFTLFLCGAFSYSLFKESAELKFLTLLPLYVACQIVQHGPTTHRELYKRKIVLGPNSQKRFFEVAL